MRELPDEPEAGAPNVAEVVLHALGAGKKFTRRFLKTDNVQILYQYVRTLLDEDLAFEYHNSEFEIM